MYPVCKCLKTLEDYVSHGQMDFRSTRKKLIPSARERGAIAYTHVHSAVVYPQRPGQFVISCLKNEEREKMKIIKTLSLFVSRRIRGRRYRGCVCAMSTMTIIRIAPSRDTTLLFRYT